MIHKILSEPGSLSDWVSGIGTWVAIIISLIFSMRKPKPKLDIQLSVEKYANYDSAVLAMINNNSSVSTSVRTERVYFKEHSGFWSRFASKHVVKIDDKDDLRWKTIGAGTTENDVPVLHMVDLLNSILSCNEMRVRDDSQCVVVMKDLSNKRYKEQVPLPAETWNLINAQMKKIKEIGHLL
ncbi:hypothetical protein VDS59_10330 [Levilactobacillus brevis]|uniref:hypothetical protein n=1 Tax=Levilactobacillus brevis TaxID=1580 RepID=UPI00324E1E57